MNWLAHLILSKPTSEFRIGNLLPDILRRFDIAELPAMFQPGVACHREIDRFTDLHPVFQQSRQRLAPPFRRYGGILVDIFYDHFLARAWSQYSPIPLDRFVDEVHTSFSTHRQDLPGHAYTRLMEIRSGHWLASYQHLEGVRRALDGIGARLRRPLPLGEATQQLEKHYDHLEQDFRQFFPQVSHHVGVRLGV